MSRLLIVLLCAVQSFVALGQSLNGIFLGSRVFPSLEEYKEENGTPVSLVSYQSEVKSLIESKFGYGVALDFSLLEEWDIVTAKYPGGDEVDFESGKLAGYDLETPRFLAADDIFQGGLRVGRGPSSEILVPREIIIIEYETEKDAPLFNRSIEIPGRDASFKYNMVEGRVTRICMPLRLT